MDGWVTYLVLSFSFCITRQVVFFFVRGEGGGLVEVVGGWVGGAGLPVDGGGGRGPA